MPRAQKSRTGSRYEGLAALSDWFCLRRQRHPEQLLGRAKGRRTVAGGM